MLRIIRNFQPIFLKRPFNLILITQKSEPREKIKGYVREFDSIENGFSIHCDASFKNSNSYIVASIRYVDGVLFFWKREWLVCKDNNSAEEHASKMGAGLGKDFRFKKYKVFTDSMHAMRVLQGLQTPVEHTASIKNGLADSLTPFTPDIFTGACRILMRQVLYSSECARLNLSNKLGKSLIASHIPQYKPKEVRRLRKDNQNHIVRLKSNSTLMYSKFLPMIPDADIFTKTVEQLQHDWGSTSKHMVSCLGVVHSIGNGCHFLLGYASKGSLEDLLAVCKKFNEADIASILRQVLLGLLALHHNLVSYINITPRNVLIDDDGVVKLCDFGVIGMISRSLIALRGAEHVFKDKKLLHNMTYMSPERVAGNCYDTSSHIWSIGLLALELGGCTPYGADTVCYTDILELHESDAPVAPKVFSPDFADFISICLEKDAKMRATPEQLLDHHFLKMAADSQLKKLPNKKEVFKSEVVVAKEKSLI